jgi:hypothetical protein
VNPDLNCADVLDRLPEYLANALEPPQSDDVAAHLESCPDCAMALATERRLDQLVTHAVNDAAPSSAGLQLRVAERIAGRPAVRAQWWRMAAVAAAVASMALGLAIWRGVGGYQVHLLCADAADDHHTEITLREARRWRTSPQEISDLAKRELGSADLPQTIEGEHLSLSRAKVCRLRGSRYMHLVYAGAAREVSVFLALDKPGQALNRNAMPTPIHDERDLGLDVSTFRLGNLVVVVTSDMAAGLSTQVANELAHTF